MGQAHQTPFAAHLGQAAQQKAAEATRALDLANTGSTITFRRNMLHHPGKQSTGNLGKLFFGQTPSTVLATVLVNQEQVPDDLRYAGVSWRDLGNFRINGTTLTVELSNLADEFVIADAVRIERLGDLTGPEIQVLEGDTDLYAGFSLVTYGGTRLGVPLTRTFTVRNLGTADLTLSPTISVPAGYTLVSSFGSTTLAPDASTTFMVRLNATAAGLFGGQVSFTSNDSDESGFSFRLTGTVASFDLIPLPNRRDHVFDAARNTLYITTDTGTVERFSMATGTLLSPLRVGNQLNGLDITTDGNRLYVAEGLRNVIQGFIRKVDLTTGNVVNVTYPGGSADYGTYLLSIAANGVALFTGTGSVRRLRTSDDTFPSGPTTGGSEVFRGADRSLLFGISSGLTPAPVFTYDSASDTFTERSAGMQLETPLGSVSRDGSRIAVEVSSNFTRIYDRTLTAVRDLPINGGVIFDPVRDQLYGVDAVTDQIVVFDTLTWAELRRFAIGENVDGGTSSVALGNGVMSISPDGQWLFLSTPSGIRIFSTTARVLDNSDAGFAASGEWDTATDQGFRGSVAFSAPGDGSGVATWTFTGLPSGVYRVSATWTPHPNRATNAPFTILDGSTALATVAVDQRTAPDDFIDRGVAWEHLGGSHTISSGTLVVRLTDLADGFVIADAIRIERIA